MQEFLACCYQQSVEQWTKTWCFKVSNFLHFQVLSFWYRVPGCWEDLRDGWPFSHGKEVGLLCHHCGNGLGASWPIYSPSHVFLHYQEEPHSVHQRHSTGVAHLLGHLLQVKGKLWINIICISHEKTEQKNENYLGNYLSVALKKSINTALLKMHYW